MKSGKDLKEDLKTLKDLGVQPTDQQITIMISLRNQFEMDLENQTADLNENTQVITEAIETLKCFLGEMGMPDAVLKLAVQKCNMNIDEAAMMLTDEA